ncbi:MAG: hypothetical protein ACXU9Z_07605 [Gemmatimonadaceae bacterium]
MQKSLVCLTPATKDKPGDVVELQYESEPVQYLEPVSPYAENDSASDLGKLRMALRDAEAALRHAKSRRAGVAEIKGLQKTLDDAKRAVEKAHFDLQKERQQQRTGGDTPYHLEVAPPLTRQSLAELVEMVASVTAGVAALVKKFPLPCNATPRCTPGRGHYKCARCRKAAAA